MHPVFRWLISYTGYLAAAKVGLLLAVHANSVTPIWPPTGIALAALLVWGWSMAIPLFAAAVSINLLNALLDGASWNAALPLAVTIGVGNIVAPVAVALLLLRARFDRHLSRTTDIWLLFAAAMAGALISAVNGVASLIHWTGLPLERQSVVFMTWWVGDALGFVGFAPFLLARPLPGQEWYRHGLPLAVTALVAGLVGFDPLHLGQHMPLAYLALLPLVWLGVRGGPHAVALGYVLCAVILVLATNLGHGPVAQGHYRSPLVALAAFLAIGALLSHLLGVWSFRWAHLLAETRARGEADARFRLLFEQSSDPHLLFDHTGIIDCNKAAIDLLGYADKNQVLHLHPARLSPELQPDGRRSMDKSVDMDRLARTQGSHRFEWTHQRKDGSGIPVEVTLTPVLLEGKDTLLVVWHDLTRHKAVEQAIAHARDEAQAALQAKSDFLATMSHELRTPLNGVIGMAGLLRGTPLNNDQQEQVEIIHTCAGHLLELIDDILDISRLESGRIELESSAYDPVRLEQDVLAIVGPHARAKGLDLQCDRSDGLPTAILGDAGRLRQIVLNLLGNAVKFTDQGTVVLRMRYEEGWLMATVRDTGIGMDADTLGRLFQPFTQADASITRRFGGSGLGLVISRRLAELMGGSLSVTSVLGQGSTFTLRVPAPPTTDTIRHPVHLPAHGRILVVDDDPVNRKVAKLLIESAGHDAVLVTTGHEALRALASGGLDLALIDLHLPDLDGHTVAVQARAAGCRIPLLLTTADQVDTGSQAAGLDGVLSKPYGWDDVKERWARGTRSANP